MGDKLWDVRPATCDSAIQTGDNIEFMSQLDTLGRHISAKIRQRGREYFESNAVEILYTDPDFVSAQVAGTEDYAVDLEREHASLICSCECPYFEENSEVCKHIWATLLELEHRGHLAKWKSRFPVELIPTAPDGDFDDPGFDDPDRNKAIGHILV